MAEELGEFALIERFFSALGARRSDVRVGVGDDGAVLTPPTGQELVAVTDTLVEGRHFPPGSPAASVGHRALAVNLSDIAAMGARPAWALLALTLPRANALWLREFARGFQLLAQDSGVALVGGDTTAGPLCITVSVLGFVAVGQALRRSGAQPGDILFVSGTLGDAARGLQHELAQGGIADGEALATDRSRAAALRQRFLYPSPRLSLGVALSDLASACIDISDGLAADAGKMAAASGCGALIDADSLPLSLALRADVGDQTAIELALTGGDDYELCFAVPPGRLDVLKRKLPMAQHGYQCIGELCAERGVRVRQAGQFIELNRAGFDHFR